MWEPGERCEDRMVEGYRDGAGEGYRDVEAGLGVQNSF